MTIRAWKKSELWVNLYGEQDVPSGVDARVGGSLQAVVHGIPGFWSERDADRGPNPRFSRFRPAPHAGPDLVPPGGRSAAVGLDRQALAPLLFVDP